MKLKYLKWVLHLRQPGFDAHQNNFYVKKEIIFRTSVLKKTQQTRQTTQEHLSLKNRFVPIGIASCVKILRMPQNMPQYFVNISAYTKYEKNCNIGPQTLDQLSVNNQVLRISLLRFLNQ